MTAQVREVYTWDHERLWRTIHAFSGSRPIADEAVTEAFAQALRLGDAIRDVTVFVWRSAFTVARSELARQRSESMTARSDRPPPPADEDDAVIAEIHHRLEALDEGDRQLLAWHHIGGWTANEMAPALGQLAATVRLKLGRAERRARALLAGHSGSPDTSGVASALDRYAAMPSPDLWTDIVARADGDDLSSAPVARSRRPLVLVGGIVAVVALVGALVVVVTGSPSDDGAAGVTPTLPTDLTATIGDGREVTLAVRDIGTGEVTGTFQLRLDETARPIVLEYENIDVPDLDDVEFVVVEVDDEPRARTIHTTGVIGTVPLFDDTANDLFTVRIVLTDRDGRAVQTSGTVRLTPET